MVGFKTALNPSLNKGLRNLQEDLINVKKIRNGRYHLQRKLQADVKKLTTLKRCMSMRNIVGNCRKEQGAV